MQNFILKHRGWTHLPPRVLTRGPITCERVDSLKIIAWPEPLGLQSPVPEVSLAPGQASSLLSGPCAAKNRNTGPWGPSPGREEGHEIKSEPYGNKEFVHSAPNTHGPWHQEPQHSSAPPPCPAGNRGQGSLTGALLGRQLVSVGGPATVWLSWRGTFSEGVT